MQGQTTAQPSVLEEFQNLCSYLPYWVTNTYGTHVIRRIEEFIKEKEHEEPINNLENGQKS